MVEEVRDIKTMNYILVNKEAEKENRPTLKS